MGVAVRHWRESSPRLSQLSFRTLFSLFLYPRWNPRWTFGLWTTPYTRWLPTSLSRIYFHIQLASVNRSTCMLLLLMFCCWCCCSLFPVKGTRTPTWRVKYTFPEPETPCLLIQVYSREDGYTSHRLGTPSRSNLESKRRTFTPIVLEGTLQ